MTQVGESSRNGAKRKVQKKKGSVRNTVGAAGRKGGKAPVNALNRVNHKKKNGSNRHHGRNAAQLESHILPMHWERRKNTLRNNKRKFEWNCWQAMTMIVIGALVISHPHQRVPGLCHDVAMSFLIKLFMGEVRLHGS